MSKVEVLVNKNYITSDWADKLEKPLTYFYDHIVPEIQKSDKIIYPESRSIFRAFKECSYDKLKVVILGQDPYFSPNQATGLAFDVNYKTKMPRSLQIICKEIVNDTKVMPGITSEIKGSYLGHLPEQGVLLLNTALTVEKNNAGVHTKLWKPFTEEVIKTINDKDNIVWILWGNHAKSFKEFITNPTHRIVEGCHPVARGAHNNFSGGKYFSKTNKFLEEMNLSKINW